MGAGWRARGTTRDPGNAEDILAAGLEAVVADPDRVGSILDHVGDVTLVFWLLGSARGEPEAIAAVHGPRLERLMEELVDTPVRGFVYEGSEGVGAATWSAAPGSCAGLRSGGGFRWRWSLRTVATGKPGPRRCSPPPSA